MLTRRATADASARSVVTQLSNATNTRIRGRKQASSQVSVTQPYAFEFCGPYLGPVCIVFGLPALVWSSAALCNRMRGWPPAEVALLQQWLSESANMLTWSELSKSFSAEAFAVYCAWFLLQVVLHLFVPGRVVSGTMLSNGSSLPYKINGMHTLHDSACDQIRAEYSGAHRKLCKLCAGWRCFVVTHLFVGALHALGIFQVTWIVDHFPQVSAALHTPHHHYSAA